ncbi:ABC transporter permease [Siphonobacter aquaeclarae]|uniref:FtsX-like permease family protein n=1 Tax=Siphonobacter aquaeclarae TaxID=563176 RepID=A0A1G9I9C8_9BACT|nr:ABC transporter permease [Siphonobacter aquaeclarae]SDL21444.1 FtsX-like permease family protein [Siphonobacter aquaeclarae]
MGNRLTPPRWANALLTLFFNPREREEIEGDLLELFERRAEERNVTYARIRYARDVFSFLSPFRRKRTIGPLYEPEKKAKTSLLQAHYWHLAVRSLLRRKVTAFVQVSGLAVGLAAGLVLFLLVDYLFSFDRYHPNAARIAWVVTDVKRENTVETDATPRPLGEALRQDYSLVEDAVRLETLFGKVLSVGANRFEESRNICLTEPSYLRVFDVRWQAGDRMRALSRPAEVVLSERYAAKYFGKTNPLGKTIRLDGKTDLTVTGIIGNPPSNTQLRFDALISLATVPELSPDWSRLRSMCFVLLREGARIQDLQAAFPLLEKKYQAGDGTFRFRALPLSDLCHERSGPAPRPLLYAIMAMGVLLVVSACLNFVNIATAQSLRRGREIGIRKASGSSRRQLILQFMTETVLLTAIVAVLALFLAEAVLPFLNRALHMLGADLSVSHLLRARPFSWFILLLVGITLLAGGYPAWIQSGFNVSDSLKNRLTYRQAGRLSVRKALVVTQFFITLFFLIGILAVWRQLSFMQQSDLGFRTQSIALIPAPSRPETLQRELAGLPGVTGVSLCDQAPASFQLEQTPFTFGSRTSPEKAGTQLRVGDHNYLPVFGLRLRAGRNLTSGDSTEVLVNESFVRALGMTADGVLRQRMRVMGWEKRIVGVVADFRSAPFREPVRPLTILNDTRFAKQAAVASGRNSMPEIEAHWRHLYPEGIFRSTPVEDLIAGFYTTENVLFAITRILGLIALFTSCLGLYGLVRFVAEARKKEIGVRKILGASTGQVLWLFGKEFGRLTLIGFALAAPLAGWLMNKWLEGYAYRIPLQAGLFATALGIVCVLAFLTVGGVAWRTAKRNPAEALKTE